MGGTKAAGITATAPALPAKALKAAVCGARRRLPDRRRVFRAGGTKQRNRTKIQDLLAGLRYWSFRYRRPERTPRRLAVSAIHLLRFTAKLDAKVGEITFKR